MSRVGKSRIYTPYMAVYLVNSMQDIPIIHRIYMVLVNPTYEVSGMFLYNLTGDRASLGAAQLERERQNMLLCGNRMPVQEPHSSQAQLQLRFLICLVVSWIAKMF